MPSARVNVNQLTGAINEALGQFAGAVTSDVRECVEDVGRDTLNEIKSNARAYGWKDYAKTWHIKIEPLKRGVGSEAIIYSAAPGYRIAHLLEKSHALRNGGRSVAKPHIAPAEAKAQEKFFKLIRQRIGG